MLSIVSLILLTLFPLSAARSNELVSLEALDMTILRDIKWASAKNPLGMALYPEPRCILRKEVADALIRAQQVARLQGRNLKVFDCYRPVSIERRLRELLLHKKQVSLPELDSAYTRGAAVDVTFTDGAGNELKMPSDYGVISVSESLLPADKLRMRLAQTMEKEGFLSTPGQWWRYTYKDWTQFPSEDVPTSAIK